VWLFFLLYYIAAPLVTIFAVVFVAAKALKFALR
jgi:hypothetical protein